MRLTKSEKREYAVYAIVWLAIGLAPLITAYVRRMANPAMGMDWWEVFMSWKLYAIFLAAFLVHNFLMAPLLVYRRRKSLYFACMAVVVGLFIFVQCQTPGPQRLPVRGPRAMMEAKSDRPAPPPHRPKKPGDMPPPPPDRGPVDFGFNDVLGVMMLLLMMGMNLGVKLYFKTDEDAREMKELERRSLEQQLEYLKYQINPHFFMNTLNNIHALVDIDPERAKETILILSRIMRHVLYEGDKSKISLQREVDFLHNYIELMRIRYTDSVSIHLDMPDHIPDVQIPPLIFITFVENAFKHGVSYRKKSFIDISLRADAEQIAFRCTNSKREKTGQHQSEELSGGMGLKNIRQRLNLLYGDNYSLEMNDGKDEYEVKLSLNLQSDDDNARHHL